MDEYIKRETAVRAVMAAKWVDGSDGAMAMEIVASASSRRRGPGGVVQGLSAQRRGSSHLQWDKY